MSQSYHKGYEMYLQSYSFANLNLLLFLLLQKLPIVVIQTFGYHGNVTSRFSSLLFLTNTYGRFQFFFKKNNKEMIVPWNFIKHMNLMSQSQGSKVGSENE